MKDNEIIAIKKKECREMKGNETNEKHKRKKRNK